MKGRICPVHAPGTPLVVVEPSNDVLRRWRNPEQILTERERQRADAYRSEQDRRDYVAAHVLMRECAALYAGTAVELLRLQQRCAVCGSTRHGKPSFAGEPGLYVSLSHTDRLVAATVGSVPVGIDVERRGSRLWADWMLSGALTAAEILGVQRSVDPEIAFLQQWVRKEALIKVGAADLDDLAAVDLSALPLRTRGGARETAWGGWRMLDLLDDDAIACAVAAVQPVATVAFFGADLPGLLQALPL
jgi:4'-phosphopantetheinyl transferase